MNGSFSLFLKLEAECDLSLEDINVSAFFKKLSSCSENTRDYLSFLTQVFHLEHESSRWYSLLDSTSQKFCLKNFEQARRKIDIYQNLRSLIEKVDEKLFLNISELKPQPLTSAIIGYSHYSLSQDGLPAYLGLLYSHDKILMHLKKAFEFNPLNTEVNDPNVSRDILEVEKLWESRDKLFLQMDCDEDQAHTMIYIAKTHIRLWFHLLENIFLESEDPRFWGVSRHALPRRIDSLVDYYLSGL